MKKLATISLFLSLFLNVYSQCLDGAIGVSGAGCGCLAGCNLTALGGPNCGGGVGGNCSAGYVPMQTDIIVPDGCTYTVTATMRNRPGGCTASGADGNCQTCDVVKVDIPGGPKLFQQGGSNSTLNDSYTLVGPGTIRVSGRANRADEIITYTITSSGVFCLDCNSILPINLLEFNATPNKNVVDIIWITGSELNNNYFILERSRDGITFENYHQISGMGNTNNGFQYKIVDSSPIEGISYYRLKQVDFDGNFTYSDIKSVYFEKEFTFEVFPNPANSEFTIQSENIEKINLSIFNAVGESVNLLSYTIDDKIIIDSKSLSNGIYFIHIQYENKIYTKKIIIQK